MSQDKQESLIQRIYRISQEHPSVSAQLVKDSMGIFQAVSYAEFMKAILKTAFFFKHKCKVKKGDHIGFICDNRAEWAILDLGLQALSAIDVPRGTDTNVEEINHILLHSDSRGCIFETVATYQNIAKHNPKLFKKFDFVFFVQDDRESTKEKIKLPKHSYFYHEIAAQSLPDADAKTIQQDIAQTSPEDIATIIYTSGTTAEPKGVCLTQRAFEVQIDKLVPRYLPFFPGEVFLSILPVWHSYAREIMYIVFGSGATVAYSKPIGKILLADIIAVQAQYMTSVPRIWEGVYTAIHKKVKNGSSVKQAIFALAVQVGKAHSYLEFMLKGGIPDYKPRSRILDRALACIPYCLIYPLRSLLDLLVFKKIRALLGKGFRAGISGGGALAPHIDRFFHAAKIKILEGYGMTEVGPVMSVRKYANPEMDSVGKLVPRLESKVIDKNGKLCKHGETGVLYIRSDQTMNGYYKNEAATNATLDKDGWLNTGDLVMQSRNGCIKIMGRAKDTIVLSSGENIEPGFIEDVLKKIDYIDQVMVVGQDRKTIAALIVPNVDELVSYYQTLVKSQGHPPLEGRDNASLLEELNDKEEIRDILVHEIAEVSTVLNAYEKVHKFSLLSTQFVVGEELTQTLKLKRPYITEKYKKEIDLCYK